MRYERPASIIVACRNEEDNIEACLRQVASVLPAAEILVVAGGSDRTCDLAEAFSRGDPRVRAVRHAGDRGKGHAIRTGISLASHHVMAQFDADLQFSAEDLPALLQPVADGACDLCTGSRFVRGADRAAASAIASRDLGNRIVSAYASLLIGRRVTDVTSGMKAWTREAIQRIDFRDDAYSYEVEIVVRAARLGLRHREVPVRYTGRAAGQSMHRNSLALARAGLVIMGKALGARRRA